MDLSSILKPPTQAEYAPSAAQSALTVANDPSKYLALQVENIDQDARQQAYKADADKVRALATLLAQRDMENEKFKTQANLAGTVHKDVGDLSSLLGPLGLNINAPVQNVMDASRIQDKQSTNAMNQSTALKNEVDAGFVPKTQDSFNLQDMIRTDGNNSFNPMATPDLLKAGIAANGKKKDENMVTREERVGSDVLKSKITPEEANRLRTGQGTTVQDTNAGKLPEVQGGTRSSFRETIKGQLPKGVTPIGSVADAKTGGLIVTLSDGRRALTDKHGTIIKYSE